MPGIASSEPLPAWRAPMGQDIQVAGKSYVLVPKGDYERLCLRAEGPREDVSVFAGESIGADLRARRHQAGLTLAVIAQRAGIRQETLCRIENGRTDPSVRTVRSILRALDQK